MARYTYLAVDAEGRERRGGIDAPTEAVARANLERRKLLPVSVRPAANDAFEAAGAATAPGAAVRGNLRQSQLLIFSRQLATLIDAAVPVDEALAMIAAQQESPTARRIILDVQAGVVEGLRLAEALARHPKSFSGMYRAVVSGGERAGRLGHVLGRLADYLAKAHALRSKITTAMVYPIALSLVALTVVVCLMVFVVPTLVEQFQSFEARLPLITQVLITTSWVLTTYWPLLLLLLVGAGLFGRLLLSRESVRVALDGAFLHLPVLGRRVRDISASRFIRAVALLAGSGLPVLESVRAARDAVGNRVVNAAVGAMATAIEQGEPLSLAMRQSGVMPPMVVYMTASGENAGELPAMLEKAADHLDQEVESFTAAALSLLEPAIIVFMGATVAGIVLAIMLPILQLNRMVIG